ncbi:type II secretion system F family protein [bacterium]|nr:type II secretion system F family protein [bacterium]
MAAFKYKAVTPNGQVITDVFEAPNEQAVTREIYKKGYRPISIKADKDAKAAAGSSKSGPFAKKIKTDEIVLITRQLVTLIRAGVPLVTTLEALRDQSSKLMGEVLNKVYVDVMSGKSFSQALDQHPKVFSKLYVNSVKAGEMSGSLDTVLERMGALLKHDEETKKRVKSAMQYPTFVIIAMIIAMIIIMTKVVPNFAKMFEGLKMQLPIFTRILLGTSKFFQNNILYIVVILVAGVIGFKWYISTPKGRFWWDGQIIKIPLIGNLALKSAMARFTRMFETLNRSGMPIIQTLSTVAAAVGNVVIEKQIKAVALGVEKGEGISGSMKKYNLFPPMVIRMISIGEQSGSLDNMLSSVADHYDVEVDYAIKGLTSMIEPILTVVIGGAVVVMALGIFLPMWNMIGAINQ